MSSLFKLSKKERASARMMGRFNKELVAAIYRATKDAGITQKEIAERLDVNKSTISRLLQGRGNPTLRTIADICAVIGLEAHLSFERPITNTLRSNSFGTQVNPSAIANISKNPKVLEYGA